jgi:hypothetical protein
MTKPQEGPYSADARYRQADRVAWRDVAGEVLIIHPARSLMYPLDDVGSAIWKLLDGTRDARAIAAELRREFEVGEDDALRDVIRFLGELAEAGLTVRA